MTYKIEKLRVVNFRNLSEDIFEFSKGINCILGENGNGKTNILEAIHVLATKKSFRKNSSFPQFLSVDGEKPEIILSSVLSDQDENPFSYNAKVDNSKYVWSVDSKTVKRKLDIKVVFINPFDSYSFHNSASFRRTWFNNHFSKIDDSYKKLISKYDKSLRFKNNLLSKKPNKLHQQLKVINLEIAKLSAQITSKRLVLLKELEQICGPTFQELFSKQFDLNIGLDSKFIGLDESKIFNELQSRVEKDLIIGFSTIGIHKDDYVLLLNGMNSYDYSSLGQQKMSYLGLIFAYIELFRYKFRVFPIVLIDDVSGELDRCRWGMLIDYLRRREFQVLITTANENFKDELEKIEIAKKFYIEGGSIKQTL